MALWQRMGAQGSAIDVYEDLVARYSQMDRAYHTLEHIGHCLDEFELVRHLAGQPDAVELALWFHDAVYDAKATNCEARSAALAEEMVRSAVLPDELGATVAGLIMATKHSAIPADSDTRLLVDIDLSILGQPEGRFDQYEREIRQEYAWVPEDAFVAARTAILAAFIGRPSIYSTETFRFRYETQARANIARSLARLRT